MIVWRAIHTPKRGHAADVVALNLEWHAKFANDSRVKGSRVLSSHIIGSNVVVGELEYESLGDWESFFIDYKKAEGRSEWLERLVAVTTAHEHSFWVVEGRG